MAGELLSAGVSLRSQLWFRWTGKCFEIATSHMQTVVHHNFRTVKTTNKMTRLLIVIVTAILFCSCGQERPKINHEVVDTTSVVDDRIKDTTKILVSELPIKFDSTDILLFAIGLVDLQERGGYSKIVSGSYSSSEIASAYFNSDNLIGNFINIVFQDKSGNEKKLTDKKIKIRSINFLRDIWLPSWDTTFSSDNIIHCDKGECEVQQPTKCIKHGWGSV
jgi:hypothetical protein